MGKRIIFIGTVLTLSGILVVYAAETIFDHENGATKWAHVLGYVSAPWMIGCAIAGVMPAWTYPRRPSGNFFDNLFKATGIFLAIIAMFALLHPVGGASLLFSQAETGVATHTALVP